MLLEGSTSRNQERFYMFNCKVIRPVSMEENFLNNLKSYIHICQGMLMECFTKSLDRMFPNFLREFYSNLQYEDLPLNSFVRGQKIESRKD